MSKISLTGERIPEMRRIAVNAVYWGAISERTCAGRRLFDSRQEAATKARKRGREHALSEAEGALAPPNPRYARKGSRGRLPHIFARATKNVLPDVDISGAAAQVEAEAASATNFAA